MRSYVTAAITVKGSPKLVCTIPQEIDKAWVRNVGNVTVYIGGENVSARSGFPVEPGEVQEVPCFDSDIASVYVVAADGDSSELRVLFSS